MRYKPEHKEQTRKKILAAAERSFKKSGFSGIGVDGLAKEAGVTSGAFYGHFPSKNIAFKEAVVSGLDELQVAIAEMKQSYGDNWWKAFAEFYTTQKRTCDLSESCTLQSLSHEVARSDEDIQAAFESQLLEIIELASSGQNKDKTWATFAMLIGGVTLARAVKDKALSDEIATAVKKEVINLHKDNE